MFISKISSVALVLALASFSFTGCVSSTKDKGSSAEDEDAGPAVLCDPTTKICVDDAVMDVKFDPKLTQDEGQYPATGTVTAVYSNGTADVTFSALYIGSEKKLSWDNWYGQGTYVWDTLSPPSYGGINTENIAAKDLYTSITCVQGISVGASVTLSGSSGSAKINSLWQSGSGDIYGVITDSSGVIAIELPPSQLALLAVPGSTCSLPDGGPAPTPTPASTTDGGVNHGSEILCDPTTQICVGAAVMDTQFNPQINQDAGQYPATGSVTSVYSDGTVNVSFTNLFLTSGKLLWDQFDGQGADVWDNLHGINYGGINTENIAATSLYVSIACVQGISAGASIVLSGSNESATINSLWQQPGSGNVYGVLTVGSSSQTLALALPPSQLALLAVPGVVCSSASGSQSGSGN